VAKRKQYAGQVVLIYGLLYAVARFTVEFLARRSTWVCLVSIDIAILLLCLSPSFCAAFLFYKRRRTSMSRPVAKQYRLPNARSNPEDIFTKHTSANK